MPKTKPFDSYFQRYEQWFEDHHFIYLSEVLALKSVAPVGNSPVEIGIGSGRFALPLQIYEGVDPSRAMRKIAIERGINAEEGVAESLPYKDRSKDYVLLVTTICFVDDIHQTMSEIYRILQPGGTLVIGFIDRDSPLGKIYKERKQKSVFYRDAVFYSTPEVYGLLRDYGFTIDKTLQTVFGSVEDITEVQEPREGYGEGNFVAIKAIKE